MPIGAAVGIGGDILGGILGSSAASKAAAAQQAAANAAKANTQANQNASTDYQTGVANQQTGLLQPFNTAGQSAIGSLSGLLQPGGQLTQGYGSFQAPTGVTEQNDPGYQFRLQQGLGALQNSAAARGGLLSGNTAQAIENYAQGDASNEYGNVYNRALQTYGTNFNTYNTNQNNLYNRLAGVSSLGAQAGSSLGGLLQSGANNISNVNNVASGLVGGELQNAGTAQASGIIGSNNAWQNALGGITNSIGSLGGLFGSSPQSTVGNFLAGQQAQNATNSSMSGYAPYGAPIVNPYG